MTSYGVIRLRCLWKPQSVSSNQSVPIGALIRTSTRTSRPIRRSRSIATIRSSSISIRFLRNSSWSALPMPRLSTTSRAHITSPRRRALTTRTRSSLYNVETVNNVTAINTTYATYGQLTWHPGGVSPWAFTVGARYTKDERRAENFSTPPGSTSYNNFSPSAI